MAKYVFMVRDELGDECRAFGTEFLSGVHEFPRFDPEDEAMSEAFVAWKSNLVRRGQQDWESTFGPESKIFLERLASDMTLSEMVALGWGEL